jgi:hypothetical protein
MTNNHATQVQTVCKKVLERNGNKWMAYSEILDHVGTQDKKLFTQNSHCHLRTGLLFEIRKQAGSPQQYRLFRSHIPSQKITKPRKTTTQKCRNSEERGAEKTFGSRHELLEKLKNVLKQNNNQWMTAKEITNESFPEEASYCTPIYNLLYCKREIFERITDGRLKFRLKEWEPTCEDWQDNIDEDCLITTLEDIPTRDATSTGAQKVKELPEFAIVYPISDDEND